MQLLDLARQVASDAIVLRQAASSETLFMTTTPVEYLGAERAARAHACAKYVRDGETLGDVDAVALRLLPYLTTTATVAK
jgi:hypothetical protein